MSLLFKTNTALGTWDKTIFWNKNKLLTLSLELKNTQIYYRNQLYNFKLNLI